MDSTQSNGEATNETMPHLRASPIRMSPCAENTLNPIRKLVDHLVIKPNPDKAFLRLSIGDPSIFGNFNPPPELINAVAEQLQTSCYGYCPAHGMVSAREAIAEYYTTDASPLDYNDVFITSGCSDALRICIDAIASSERNILLPSPGFSVYQTICGNRGVESRFYNLDPDKDWEIDLAHMRTQLDANTAAILVTNPSNPCGSAFTKQHMLDILKVAEEYGVPIIADEIYHNMVFNGESYSFGELSRNVPVISCGGLAKRWLVPGWRVGWLIVHDRHQQLSQIRQGITRLCQVIIGSNTLIQAAIPKILATVPQSFYTETLTKLNFAANLLYTELCKVPELKPCMPQGAMYMMVKIQLDELFDIDNDMEFVEKLISEQSVFLLPANIFGMDGWVRIVLTVPDDILRDACNRVAMFCQEHSVKRCTEKIKQIEEL